MSQYVALSDICLRAWEGAEGVARGTPRASWVHCSIISRDYVDCGYWDWLIWILSLFYIFKYLYDINMVH